MKTKRREPSNISGKNKQLHALVELHSKGSTSYCSAGTRPLTHDNEGFREELAEDDHDASSPPLWPFPWLMESFVRCTPWDAASLCFCFFVFVFANSRASDLWRLTSDASRSCSFFPGPVVRLNAVTRAARFADCRSACGTHRSLVSERVKDEVFGGQKRDESLAWAAGGDARYKWVHPRLGLWGDITHSCLPAWAFSLVR